MITANSKHIRYWLIKSEPSTYSIDHLKRDKKTSWTGVRNYQARNFMRDDMHKGDLCLFYHSNTSPDLTGVVGIGKVCSMSYQDPTSLDPKSEYFEKNKKIVWNTIDIQFNKKCKKIVTLADMKKDKVLTDMVVLRKGSRLSIQPVEEKDFMHILKLSAEL